VKLRVRLHGPVGRREKREPNSSQKYVKFYIARTRGNGPPSASNSSNCFKIRLRFVGPPRLKTRDAASPPKFFLTVKGK